VPLVPAEREILQAALVGLYRLAGVQLVREQIQAVLPQAGDWDVAVDGLVIEAGNGPPAVVVYNLRQEGPFVPLAACPTWSRHSVTRELGLGETEPREAARGQPWQAFPTLEPSELLFSHVAVPWDRWVAFWQQEHDAPEPPPEPIAPIHMLPHASRGRVSP